MRTTSSLLASHLFPFLSDPPVKMGTRDEATPFERPCVHSRLKGSLQGCSLRRSSPVSTGTSRLAPHHTPVPSSSARSFLCRWEGEDRSIVSHRSRSASIPVSAKSVCRDLGVFERLSSGASRRPDHPSSPYFLLLSSSLSPPPRPTSSASSRSPRRCPACIALEQRFFSSGAVRQGHESSAQVGFLGL
jgi:hypothetical protein